MKNKPQWLLDAEAEIQKFEQTEWGKLTEKEFRRKEASSNVGKMYGTINVENGHLKKIAKKGGHVQGKVQGRKNVESGHLDRIRDIEACKKGGKRAMAKMTKDQRIKGGSNAANIERQCPHCNIVMKGGNYFRYHGDNCKSKEGVIRKTPEYLLRMSAASAAIKVTCVHCGITCTKSNHTRWHGDKCKHKKEA